MTRYVGGEQPSLDRLGGSDWAKRKGRARKAVREIAGELIKLYAARQATQGYAFGPDTPWQREMEDAFPFTETPDQLWDALRGRPALAVVVGYAGMRLWMAQGVVPSRSHPIIFPNGLDLSGRALFVKC